MIARLIEFSVRNRWLVILAWVAVAVWGLFAVLRTPVDAIPDLSENQVIVFTDWAGRSPQDIEDQVTYPLSVQLQGLAGVKAVRSTSEFGFSMINVIFDESVDFYFARQRVLERLTIAKASMPADVTPVMAPDATALGQIFWYTVEGGGQSLDELRAIQDFTVRYALASVPGVAEVATVGGLAREYQVDVDPQRLRVYDLPLSNVYAAIAKSNMSVGGKVVVTGNTEYVVRGVGWLKGVTDLEQVVVASRGGVPVRLKDVATVQLGPEFRRSALEQGGQEAVGGVVMMRYGQNPLAITQAVKAKIRDLQSGLPVGVRIVPFYDRTRLIESAIHTVTKTLTEEVIIASVAILLILSHARSAFVVCVTLPLAVLVAFLFMYYAGIPSNIMSLAGIAISIGILVDAAVVTVENATHELKEKFGDRPVTGDTTEVVVRACRLVGRPIFFSVLIMLLSFLPVFSFGGQEGKLSHPLAWTKTFAMVGVALLAVTLVPALIPLLIKGRLRREDENPIVRSFIRVYRPTLEWAIDRPGVVWFTMATILVIGAALLGVPAVMAGVLGLGVLLIGVGNRLIGAARGQSWGWKAAGIVAILVIGFLADTRLPKLGSEFMPELNEGSLMDMPVTAPRVAMAQAVDDVMVRDRLLRSFPEVEQAVGKIGRADTATDPSPTDMVETVVSMRPRELWPHRKLEPQDATKQARVVAAAMVERGLLKGDFSTDGNEVLDTAVHAATEQFDRAMREFAKRRLVEHEPVAGAELVRVAFGALVDHARDLPTREGAPALAREPQPADEAAAVRAGAPHGLLLAQLPRQEEADKLLATVRAMLVDRGVLADRDDLLIDPQGRLREVVRSVRQTIGLAPPSFAERLFARLERTLEWLSVDRMKTLNWELTDAAVPALNDFLVDALHRAAVGTPHAGAEATDGQLHALRDALGPPLARSLILRAKSKADVRQEMDRELQVPGWGNVWTQPIINRVNMLATGVRTQIGVRVFGPTGKPLPEAIADIQRVSQQIAERLRTIDGAVDVQADQTMGKRYVEVTIDRERAARYGVNMAEVGEAVETALGGGRATTTVEGRQRFPVRVRYARDDRQDVDSIGDVLVTGAMSGASTSVMSGDEAKSQTGAGSGMVQVPLRMVADIRAVEGPSMIKGENGRLRGYVTLNVRGRDIVGFVDEAKAAVRSIEQELAGTGMNIEWSGEYEAQLRARRTLSIIFPIAVGMILLLLYVTFHDGADMLLMALAVPGALAGAVMFQGLFGFNFSVVVSIGYVAAFGMATQTGVIMLTYLREAVDRRGGLAEIGSLDELRQAVVGGAVHRLRPKLLTEGVAIIGLVPMIWSTGTGAEIMRPLAAPVLGGLLIADEVVDLMIPVLFYWVRRRRWLKLHGENRVEVAEGR